LGQLAPDRLAVVAGEGDQAHQRGVERGQRDAGEQQRAHRQLALPADDAHQQRGGGDPAAEGRHRQCVGAKGHDPGPGKLISKRDGRDRRKGRARGDADQPRIGERVAEHALHHRAGNRQR
jgi:hypothetical protein